MLLLAAKLITDEETEKEDDGSKSLSIFKKILSFFSNFGNFLLELISYLSPFFYFISSTYCILLKFYNS